MNLEEELKSESGYYLISSYSSGCFFGKIKKYDESHGVAILSDSRRLRRWRIKNKKGSSLAEISLKGLDAQYTEVCGKIDSMLVSEILELIPLSLKIAAEISEFKVHNDD